MFTQDVFDQATGVSLREMLAGLSTSRTLFVSSSAGRQGRRGDPTRPFPTLDAAIAVAEPGDSLDIAPGNYDSRNLLRNGVNIFSRGATCQYTGTGSSLLTDDSTGPNIACTAIIKGGRWIHAGSGGAVADKSVLNITKTGSVVIFEPDEAINQATGGTNRSPIVQGAGTVYVKANRLVSNEYDGIIGPGLGKLYLEAQEVIAAASGSGFNGDVLEYSGNHANAECRIRIQKGISLGDATSCGINLVGLVNTTCHFEAQTLTAPRLVYGGLCANTLNLILGAGAGQILEETGFMRIWARTLSHTDIVAVDQGGDRETGYLEIFGARIETTGANKSATSTAGALSLVNCQLIATGSGNGIAGTGNARIFNVLSNLAAGGSVTTDVGTLTTDAQWA